MDTKKHTEAHGDKVGGYRKLSNTEINDINALKELENSVGNMITLLQNYRHVDQRWLAIARTDLQKGFMAAVRSIAKPDSQL